MQLRGRLMRAYSRSWVGVIAQKRPYAENLSLATTLLLLNPACAFQVTGTQTRGRADNRAGSTLELAASKVYAILPLTRSNLIFPTRWR
jgi:hypothetical protein